MVPGQGGVGIAAGAGRDQLLILANAPAVEVDRGRSRRPRYPAGFWAAALLRGCSCSKNSFCRAGERSFRASGPPCPFPAGGLGQWHSWLPFRERRRRFAAPGSGRLSSGLGGAGPAMAAATGCRSGGLFLGRSGGSAVPGRDAGRPGRWDSCCSRAGRRRGAAGKRR